MEPYRPDLIEEKWQKFWDQQKIAYIDTSDHSNALYMLMMFPYPSGDLHVGHGRNYILGDAIFRWLTMKGKRVLNPMGWDAFGLPAENAAIKHGIHPRKWTIANIQRMKKQFSRWGILYDWSKELASCEPEYYKWNQWLFLKMLQRNLAYRAFRAVNWCPSCKTVLANEQVYQGACERCSTQVVQRELEQWFLKITAYAERLLEGLDRLDKWPERVKTMQRNWIGKSEGCDVTFKIAETGDNLIIYTTRLDTIFGATFVALAPEHPLASKLASLNNSNPNVKAFIEKMKSTPRNIREAGETEKEGIFTGFHAINPYNGEKVPIWLANFVLMEYGTGAIMAVPAHDQRDFEFAQKYNLPIKTVVKGPEMTGTEELKAAYEGTGTLINSGQFNGLDSEQAKIDMAKFGEEKGFAKRKVRYRLRDWLISRQRYWGTPIPIIYCDKCGTVPVPEEDLPVLLPTDIKFAGAQGNPLASSPSFVHTKCPRCGENAKRETDTMDTFVDSSWYYLRFLDPHIKDAMFDTKKAKEWMPVNIYIGGIEHATMHLIYARFIYKVLYDMGLVPNDEPFEELFNQGMIYKVGWRDPKAHMAWIPASEIEFREDKAFRKITGSKLIPELSKMSKSRYNVVPPDELIARYGADTERVYTLFLGPPEKDAEWRDDAVPGAFRFLGRVWALLEKVQNAPEQGSEEAERKLAYAVSLATKRVSQDMEKYRMNTAVAALMELTNSLSEAVTSGAGRDKLTEAYDTLLKLLHPFAPHITEELWQRRGYTNSILKSNWPTWDEQALKLATVTIAVQVNGKLRGQVEVPTGASNQEVEEAARKQPNVAKWLSKGKVIKVIHVPGRLVNFVVKKEK